MNPEWVPRCAWLSPLLLAVFHIGLTFSTPGSAMVLFPSCMDEIDSEREPLLHRK